MQREVNGNTVYYEISGPEDAPVVMFSQSLACSSAMWKPQVAALEGSFRVLRYDTRGHGGSAAPAGDYRFDGAAWRGVSTRWVASRGRAVAANTRARSAMAASVASNTRAASPTE